MGLYSWIEKKVEKTTKTGRKYNRKTTVASWDKDWMIHSWFVDNVQGGKDTCAAFPLDIDKVRELRDMCNTIVADAEKETARVEDKDTYKFSMERTKAVVMMFRQNPAEYTINRPMGWDFIMSLARTRRQLDGVIADYEREVQNGVAPMYTYTGSW